MRGLKDLGINYFACTWHAGKPCLESKDKAGLRKRAQGKRSHERNDSINARQLRIAHNIGSETVTFFILSVDDPGWNTNGILVTILSKDAEAVYRYFDQLWGRINYQGVYNQNENVRHIPINSVIS